MMQKYEIILISTLFNKRKNKEKDVDETGQSLSSAVICAMTSVRPSCRRSWQAFCSHGDE